MKLAITFKAIQHLFAPRKYKGPRCQKCGRKMTKYEVDHYGIFCHRCEEELLSKL